MHPYKTHKLQYTLFVNKPEKFPGVCSLVALCVVQFVIQCHLSKILKSLFKAAFNWKL